MTALVVFVLIATFDSLHSVRGQKDSPQTQDDKMTSGLLIFAYVCFGLGAILIVIGFARLIWWAWIVKKNGPRRRVCGTPNFYTYYKDPWLRAPSIASLASGSRTKPSNVDNDADSLRVDTDVIYAQPVDARSRVLNLDSSPHTEHELSQTESQIYGETSNGTGSGQNAYSVPHQQHSRIGVPVTSIDEEPEVPALPVRGYDRDVDGSLAEADRESMREVSYVEPPADYSPTRHQGSRGAERSAHAPSELSGSELYHTAVFKDSSGSEVNRFRVAPPSGSVKSMKSLYQYMETSEPCALEDEINYTFVSSFH